jgi:hypothetical protein
MPALLFGAARFVYERRPTRRSLQADFCSRTGFANNGIARASSCDDCAAHVLAAETESEGRVELPHFLPRASHR